MVDAANIFACRPEHGHAVPRKQGRQSADMIAVMVSDQNGRQRDTQAIQRSLNRRGVTRVDHGGVASVVQKPQVVVGKRRNRQDDQTHGLN